MQKLLYKFIFIFCVVTLIPINDVYAFIGPIKPIKILLVPGHDDEVLGAEYAGLKEAKMNLAVALQLFNILQNDKRFDVHITRDSSGYTKEFSDYFVENKSEVESFIAISKKNMGDKVASGDFVEKNNTPHATAKDSVVLRLYGFNKWASENKMDAVVHIHFNDYARKNKWKMGDRKGFAIYIPEEQFANSDISFDLADYVWKELKKKYKTSNYVNELGGMIYDQKLIAIGANHTLGSSVRSLLIEYSYIYSLGGLNSRRVAYTNMANLTAVGLKKYFFPE
ncbi:MAG: N-acetylmuramoyl-L-alanine amidase [Candidatus Pacebacteria bacterium]|nr:N-acetylmuramoyl-L-alanine amidase [Candidatus Paceibacterota bacterium]